MLRELGGSAHWSTAHDDILVVQPFSSEYGKFSEKYDKPLQHLVPDLGHGFGTGPYATLPDQLLASWLLESSEKLLIANLHLSFT